MGKLMTVDGKQTTWEGLWWHPEWCSFSSGAFSMAQLKKFKGNVRLYVKKNRFYNNGENGRPNYMFCIKDAKADNPFEIKFADDKSKERMYTREEVVACINGAVIDAQNGYYDLIPEDYLGW